MIVRFNRNDKNACLKFPKLKRSPYEIKNKQISRFIDKVSNNCFQSFWKYLFSLFCGMIKYNVTTLE